MNDIHRITKKFIMLILTIGIIWHVSGCQPISKKDIIDLTRPVFFPSPPSKPRLQFLKSFSRPDDVGVEGSNPFETFIVGEPQEDDFIVKAYGADIHKGKLYVCDIGRKVLVVMDILNKTFDYFPIDSRVKLPFNIFIEPDGTKYIADPAGGAVFVYNDQDKLTRILGMGLDINPRDIFVRGPLIYITDSQNGQVVVLDKTSGKLIKTIGQQAESLKNEMTFVPDDFGIISDITLDSSGNIYVTDLIRSQIIKFDPSGQFVRAYSGPGGTAAHLLRPKGLAIDRADRIWVADSGPAEAVKIYNQQGQFLMFFGTHGKEPGKMFMPAKVIIDYDNVDLFKQYAVEGAQLEYLVLVTNQFGPAKINVYGFGTFPEIDTDIYNLGQSEPEKMEKKVYQITPLEELGPEPIR